MKNIELSPSVHADFMQQGTAVLSNGISLHFEVGGIEHEQTVILVMGLGAQMLIWPNELCQAFIDQGYRVIRFDNRDIGLSSKIRRKDKQRLNELKMMARFSLGLSNHGSVYSLLDMAEDVALLIDHLQLGSVHLIGESMGGMISQITAATYPEKVKTLGLLSTSNNRALLPPPFPKQLFSLIGKPKSTKEQDIINHTIKLFNSIGSKPFIDQQYAREMASVLYNRSYSPVGMKQQFHAVLATGSLTKFDRKITQPTIVIHGAKDRLLPLSHGRAVAKSIKDAKFHIIPDMAHDVLPVFVPELSASFVDNFKKQL